MVAPGGRPLWLWADPLLPWTSSWNRAGNAAEAMAGRGEIGLSLPPPTAPAGNGRGRHRPGGAGPLADLIFDPFFTTKAKGAGLGLCVAEGAARAHGGSTSVGPAPSGGAAFSAVLPISAGSRAPAHPEENQGRSVGTGA